MTQSGKSGKVLFWLSGAGFTLMGVGLMLIALPVWQVLPGIMFWAGLLAGIIPLFVLEARRRRTFRKYRVDRRKMQKRLCGFLSFFSNPVATAVDVCLLTALAGTAVALLLTHGTGTVAFLPLGAAVTLLGYHSIFNGRNYVFVKNFLKIRKSLEEKSRNLKEGEGS